ncbi:MAG: SCP2 sterol-binding domain-containing protein, partial [Nevskiales bacterium]
FETRVVERDEVVISNAAVELYEEIPAVKPAVTAGADAEVAAATAVAAGAEQVVTLLNDYVSQHPELVGQVGKVYQWNIKNPDLDFVLDLKNAGSVTTGTADHDCSLEIEEEDLMGLMRGEADAQKLYFGGKLKIGGDIMASQKLQFLADMDPAEVQAALAGGTAAAAEAAPAAQAGAQQVVSMLGQYVGQHPELVGQVGKSYQWNIKNPDLDFVLDLKNGEGSVTTGTADCDCSLEIEEADLMALMRGEADAQKLYFGGKLKIGGDIMASQKLQFLADMDPAEVQAALSGAAAAPAAEAPAAQAAKPTEKKAFISPKLFAALSERLSSDKAAANGAAGILQFHVTDAEQYWTVDLSGDAPQVEEGATVQPTTIFGISDADLAALVSGEADVRDLYQRGKLRVDGDVRQAHELKFLNGLV